MIKCYPYLVIESEEDYKIREYKKRDQYDESVCVWWKGWRYPIFHFGNKEFPQYYAITDNNYPYREGYTPIDKETVIDYCINEIRFHEDMIEMCKENLNELKEK